MYRPGAHKKLQFSKIDRKSDVEISQYWFCASLYLCHDTQLTHWLQISEGNIDLLRLHIQWVFCTQESVPWTRMDQLEVSWVSETLIVYFHYFWSILMNPIWFQIQTIIFICTLNVALQFTYVCMCTTCILNKTGQFVKCK